MNRSAIIKAVQSRMSDISPGSQVEVASHPFIDALLDGCVEGFYLLMPGNLLPKTSFSSANTTLFQDSDVKVYRIQLPETFVKLVSFKCNAWSRSVSQALADGSAQHKAQFGKYSFGGNNRPVVTLVSDATLGRCIEYYLNTTDVTINEALCVVKTSAESIPDNLIDSFTWYVASVAYQSMEEMDASKMAMDRVNIFIQSQ